MRKHGPLLHGPPSGEEPLCGAESVPDSTDPSHGFMFRFERGRVHAGMLCVSVGANTDSESLPLLKVYWVS